MAKKKSGKWFYIVGTVFVGAWLMTRPSDTGTSHISKRITAPATQPTPTPHITAKPDLRIPPMAEAAPLTTSSPPIPSASPTPVPSASPTPVPSASPTTETIATYRVVDVPEGDFLNLREGPGQNYPIVRQLRNGLNDIQLLGGPVANADTLWQKIDSRGIQGWVVLTYLAKDSSETDKSVATRPPPARKPNPPSDNYVPQEVRLTSAIAFPTYQGSTQTGLDAPPLGTKVKLLKINGYNVLVEYNGHQKSISASSTDLLDRMLGRTED